MPLALNLIGDSLLLAAYLGLSAWCAYVSYHMSSRVRLVGFCFGAFILLCGLTHAWGVWTAAHDYCSITSVPAGLTKMLAGLVSAFTMGFVYTLSWKYRFRHIDLKTKDKLAEIAKLEENLSVIRAREEIMQAGEKFLDLIL